MLAQAYISSPSFVYESPSIVRAACPMSCILRKRTKQIAQPTTNPWLWLLIHFFHTTASLRSIRQILDRWQKIVCRCILPTSTRSIPFPHSREFAWAPGSRPYATSSECLSIYWASHWGSAENPSWILRNGLESTLWLSPDHHHR